MSKDQMTGLWLAYFGAFLVVVLILSVYFGPTLQKGAYRVLSLWPAWLVVFFAILSAAPVWAGAQPTKHQAAHTTLP